MDAKDKDGFSLREKLEGKLKRTRSGKGRAEIKAQLAVPPFPLPLLYLWNSFQRLSGRRTGSGFGINPIAYADIEAFARLNGKCFAPFEIELIEDLDNLFRIEFAKKRD
ncbi:hypothetical protein ABH973_006699 [Bradyrhizobium ottawaense]|uniref:phage tail assembly chaperone n=1 Tax=Bradyrhizobium ottawaense TaxID=931866 RepID=UPI00351997B3